jgi:tetratricopeptide (TPR) repeat protein
MRFSMILPLVALLGFGCAARQVGPSSAAEPRERERIEGDEVRIRAGGDPLTGLDGYDSRDLFELGLEAFGREEYGISRVLFARLIAEFPSDSSVPRAHWNYALAAEHQGAALDGVAHIEAYMDAIQDSEPKEAAGARLHLAQVLQREGDFAASLPHLELLLTRSDIDRVMRWEVRAHAARAWTEEGKYKEAEWELEAVRGDVRRRSRTEGVSYPFHAAMVWYFAGELYRIQGERRQIGSTDDVEAVREVLNGKADDMLEARHHYKRALQVGREEWSGPAAKAIGGMMEHFRLALLTAPEPTDLAPDALAVYRELVEERTRQFLEKAAEDYAWVLRDSQRLLIPDRWVEEIRLSLEHCRAALEQSSFANVAAESP